MPLWFPYIPIDAIVKKDTAKLEVTPTVEARTRFERRTDRDFTSSVNDNRSDLFSRIRVGAEFKEEGGISGKIEFQATHNMIWRNSGNSSDELVGFYQGYASIPTGKGELKVGRQQLNASSRRLQASSNWGNTARTYDSIRFSQGAYDIYFAKIGWDAEPDSDVRLGGLGYKKGNDQTYIYYKGDDTSGGRVDLWTLHQWSKYKLGGFDIDAEAAIQTGRFQGKDQEAWALHFQADHKIAEKTKLIAELNVASGGSSATENRSFDSLYPSTHERYGEMDMTGWQNMEQIRFGIEQKVDKNSVFQASYSRFWLRDSRDGWYRTSLNRINRRPGGSFIDPTGMSGRTLGDELDLTLISNPDKNTQYGFTVAFFEPGTFVKNLTSNTSKQYWVSGWIQKKFRF